MGSAWDIARKQVEDSFSSKRFLFILALFLIFSLASVYVGVNNYQNSVDQYQQGFTNLQPTMPSLIDTFEIMFQFNMPLAAGLLGLLLSYDAVSKEREEGTIELLLSYPVYRDEIITGKFIASMFTVSIALLLSFVVSTGYAIFSLGIVPTMAEISRLSFIWISSVIYIAFFISLGTFFSTLFRSSWRSLIACIVILLVFLATPFLADQAANRIYTLDTSNQDPEVERRVAHAESDTRVVRTVEESDRSDEEQRDIVEAKRQRFVDTVSRLSPPTSYQKFVEAMIGSNYQSSQGSSPTLRENLSSSLGYLFYLISQTVLMFTASYTVFMRQDL